MMVDALELLRDFSALQERLVQAFIRTVAPKDMEYFRDVVDGHLTVEGEIWRHQRHGRGVRFVCDDGRVVDVHVGMAQHPAGVTSWRLLQYLDSIGVKEIVFGEKTYAAEDEAALDKLLEQMRLAGGVRAVGGRMYESVPARLVGG
jgi:hypothetical protein